MSDNYVLITGLIREHPRCLPCIAKDSGLNSAAAEMVLTVIGRSVKVHRRDTERCFACGEWTTVFLLQRPSS